MSNDRTVRPGRARVAYLFERFPSFTQTFCYREVCELACQGLVPAIFSIRRPSDEPPQAYPLEFPHLVQYLPEGTVLKERTQEQHAARQIPRAMRKTLQTWQSPLDRHRVYEAAHIGPKLRAAGIRHIHVHFAGIAARTAVWLKRFYGIGFSVTGHANDIFVEEDLPVKLQDIVDEAAFVSTVSDFSAAYLRERFPAAAGRIHRIYNGIDTSLWKASSLAADSRPVILSVGRLIEKKGFPELIRACVVLRKEVPGLRCVIIGEGPLEESLRTLVSQLDLVGCVELPGPKSQEEIAAALGAARVFALPCIAEKDGGMDNLPTVIMEAMSCGRPVVSTRIAGVPEMIFNGLNGAVVEPGHVPALAAALRDYLLNPHLARAHGLAAREHAISTFEIRETVGHLKHLLVARGKICPPGEAVLMDPALRRTYWLGRLGINPRARTRADFKTGLPAG